jgi:hypothetical protein
MTCRSNQHDAGNTWAFWKESQEGGKGGGRERGCETRSIAAREVSSFNVSARAAVSRSRPSGGGRGTPPRFADCDWGHLGAALALAARFSTFPPSPSSGSRRGIPPCGFAKRGARIDGRRASGCPCLALSEPSQTSGDSDETGARSGWGLPPCHPATDAAWRGVHARPRLSWYEVPPAPRACQQTTRLHAPRQCTDTSASKSPPRK